MNPITIRKIAFTLIHTFVVGLFLVVLSANIFQRQTSESYPEWLSFADSFLTIGSFFGLVYLAYWLFLPQHLITGKYGKFILQGLGLWGGFVAFYFWLEWFVRIALGFELQLMPASPLEIVVLMGLLSIVLGSLLRILIQWFRDAYDKAELQQRGLESELALLKQQLNPHFLFNSLNNIDALIHAQSPDASTALNKLSDMMRFVVYDSEKDLVPLEEELDYIRNYIDLQKLRLRHPENVRMEVEGEPAGKQIAPMLFISFIENAFKHSPLGAGARSPVTVSFQLSPERLVFRCRNSMGKRNKDEGSGIGLDNVRRRLGLLYKDRHTLRIKETAEFFEVEVNIEY